MPHIVFILLFIFLYYKSILSIPVQNLTDEKQFKSIEITKSDYYYKVPISEAIETIPLSKDGSRIQLLVSNSIYQKWTERKYNFYSIPYPRRLIDIDRDLPKRWSKGCIPTNEMLNGYKDPQLNELYLNCIIQEYPNLVKKYTIGKSIEGRELVVLRIQIPSLVQDRTNVFIHCGIHGNEPISIEHCYDIIIQSITNFKSYPELEKLDLWILPIANPDGVYRHWYVDTKLGRTNARGVDLNRNFPFKWDSGILQASSGKLGNPYFRGAYPASELEVQSILNLFEKEKFLFSLSIHCFANSLLVPYTIPETTNPHPNLLEEIGNKLLNGVYSHRKDKPFVTKKNLYPVDGTDQDTFFHRYGTFAYLLESSHLLERYNYVPIILEGFRPIWINLFQVAANQYKWKIKILNQNQEPIPAWVESDTYQYFEGEIRKASENGFYQELAVSPLPIKVKIAYPGYKTKNIWIVPSKNPQTIKVNLENN